MKYAETTPISTLSSHIHSFWELQGDDTDGQWERIFPDGCPGIIVNLGESCQTDNGQTIMEHGKTYVVGAMHSFKDSFIDKQTHLLGVCFKPAAFSSLYKYIPQQELVNYTTIFDVAHSFEIGKIYTDPVRYLNSYFLDRKLDMNPVLQSVLQEIHLSKGKISIYDLTKKNFITPRKLERLFNTHIGLPPKEYVNIIRFQSALAMMKADNNKHSLADISFECGFYDQAHFTNEMKYYTGHTPAQL
ncbi:helix-turn-helix domain-containing protein [Chitinophaga sp. Cy-1792]|uniref:helix-turn-helix domain-containing protein n=1 Tax=Chitinophaga sp. Cy-1792 TaxID=2608339 RepID=UPI0014232B83|nr:helix-turn-helix domain-containing protein [Chitinophaga sp. Cy-1792]NIG54680.1 AraC family transcriptional regulator [Chitinophaga sp. Cy-1792]